MCIPHGTIHAMRALLLLLLATGVSGAPVAVPEPSPDAQTYHVLGLLLLLTSRCWALATPGLFLLAGWGPRLRDALEARLGDRPWLVLAAFVVVYLLAAGVLRLPLSFLAGYLRPHAFGLSTETLAHWWQSWFTARFVGVAVAGPMLGVPFLLMRRWPERWWMANAALAAPGLVLLLVIQPIWIAPLFHDFGPMQDKALEARILDLAARCGVAESRVHEVEMSVQTKAVNAYVAGLFGTRRIVLWDTLVERLAPDEVLFIMGHELGHYALSHVALGTGLAALGAWALFFLVDRLGRRVLARSGKRWGLRGWGDPAAVPLFVLLVTLVTWVGEPIGLVASRWMEGEADRFALELTRAGEAGARAFVALQEANLSVPRPAPWVVHLVYTHPPLGDRVDMCNRYRPWAEGKPLRYGAYFRD